MGFDIEFPSASNVLTVTTGDLYEAGDRAGAVGRATFAALRPLLR